MFLICSAAVTAVVRVTGTSAEDFPIRETRTGAVWRGFSDSWDTNRGSWMDVSLFFRSAPLFEEVIPIRETRTGAVGWMFLCFLDPLRCLKKLFRFVGHEPGQWFFMEIN